MTSKAAALRPPAVVQADVHPPVDDRDRERAARVGAGRLPHELAGVEVEGVDVPAGVDEHAAAGRRSAAATGSRCRAVIHARSRVATLSTPMVSSASWRWRAVEVAAVGRPVTAGRSPSDPQPGAAARARGPGSASSPSNDPATTAARRPLTDPPLEPSNDRVRLRGRFVPFLPESDEGPNPQARGRSVDQPHMRRGRRDRRDASGLERLAAVVAAPLGTEPASFWWRVIYNACLGLHVVSDRSS